MERIAFGLLLRLVRLGSTSTCRSASNYSTTPQSFLWPKLLWLDFVGSTDGTDSYELVRTCNRTHAVTQLNAEYLICRFDSIIHVCSFDWLVLLAGGLHVRILPYM